MHTVTFDADGGSPTPSPAAAAVGSNISAPSPAPEKSGFDLTGWDRVIDGVREPFDFNNTIFSNMTLYANWSEKTAVFNYSSSNTSRGTVDRSGETVGVLTGQPSGATAAALEGYRFACWTFDGAAVSTNASFIPQKDASGMYSSADYRARFEEVTYDVYYDKNNDNYSGSVPEYSTVSINRPVTVESALRLDGYVFTAWNTKEDGSGSNFTPGVTQLNFSEAEKLAGDDNKVTLYGRWIRMYNVTFDADGGSPEPSPTATTVPENSPVPEPTPAPAKTGFTFNGWKADGSDQLYNFSTAVTDDLNLKAGYTENTTTITYASSNETMGTVDRSNETIGVVTGQPSGATASPAYGYRFVNWTLNGAEVSSSAALIPEKDASSGLYAAADYIAGFAEMVYRVSYDANNADYNGSIPDGSLVTLNESVTAAPALELDDHVFTEWNTAEDGSGTGFAPDAAELNFSELSGLDDGSGVVTLYGQWIRTYNVEWNWQKISKTDYKVTATFIDKDGAVLAENVRATVTAVTDGDIAVYTATVTFNNIEYKDERSFYTGGTGTPNPVVRERAGIGLVIAIIDYLVNGTPLPEDVVFDFNEDRAIDGRDLIELEKTVSENGYIYRIVS
ncbi:InlB B-repeat-containing protein [Methanosarcinaceae archaeon]|nr:InlB B-repeat-containing protein [Methanosarcinaceae archaeon]